MHQRPVEQCNKQRLNHSWQSGRLVYSQREVWSSVYNVPVCVCVYAHVEDSTHKAQRKGINSMLLRVEPGRHVRWNFFPQRALIWLWFKAMCILSDISLWHKDSSFFFGMYAAIWVYDCLTRVTVHIDSGTSACDCSNIFGKPCQETKKKMIMSR